MSESLFGGSHGGHGARLFSWSVAIFLVIWAGDAYVYHLETVGFSERSKQEAAATQALAAQAAPIHAAAPAKPGRRQETAHLFECIYRGLQLFEFHDDHWPGTEANVPGNLFVNLARFLSAIFTLGTPLALLGWVFRGGVRHQWHARWWNRGFTVIVGDSPKARALANDVARNRHGVVLLRRRPQFESHGPASSGVLEMQAGDGDAFWLKKLRVHRAGAVVLIGDDDAENLRQSFLLEAALKDAPPGETLVCHIQLGDLHLKRGLVSILPQDASSPLHLRRRYFNRYEIIARLLARNYPLPAALVEEVAVPEHYVIVGFGKFGQNVALKLVKMGQQVVRRRAEPEDVFEVCKPRLTIIDRAGEKAAELFFRSHPGFRDICDLHFMAADCLDASFLDLAFLEGRDIPAGRCSLIFCLESETLVVRSILSLLDSYERGQKRIDGIYFSTTHGNGVGQLLHRRGTKRSRDISIVAFASDARIFTEDVVLESSLDAMAREIHEAFLTVATPDVDPSNPAPAAAKDWSRLSEEDRESNREAADHLWAKLRTLGHELEEVPLRETCEKTDSPEALKLAQEIEDHIDELASSEHYRWMAWRLAKGWKRGDARDDEKKLHPDLVLYEALEESARVKDCAIVRVIPKLLIAGRLRIAKAQGSPRDPDCAREE